MSFVEWRDEEIRSAFRSEFGRANELLGRQLQRRITDAVWPWPNGDSPRDIVDTGALRRSYRGTPRGPTEYQHEWDVEYALAVLLGATFANGSSMPARNWIAVTLREYNWRRAYARLVKLRLGT